MVFFFGVNSINLLLWGLGRYQTGPRYFKTS